MSANQGMTRKAKNLPKARKTTQQPDGAGTRSKPAVSVCDDLQVRIATRAYELYEGRGRGDGYALEDWVQAEREVLSQVPPV